MSSPPLCLAEFEEYARNNLPKNALDYYQSGANEQHTLKENREAYKRLYILPKMLRNVSNLNMQQTVLGKPVGMPIGVAPSAMQRMAHPDGELANVRAAESMKTVYILSTIATSSIEEVASAAPNARKWFQLYIYKNRKVTEDLVRRADRAGFEAIVLTVDAPYFGTRLSDVRNKFTLPRHLRMANFQKGDAASDSVQTSQGGSGINEYVKSLMDQSITWADIDWLRSITNLPIIVKGILRPEDANAALNHGVSGIIVSNHGARQLDGVPPTIEALPHIAKAVNGKCDVYMDGGVTLGTDVFKALALGAKMVFLGRPLLWGLAYDGEAGARRVLEIIRSEFETAMALAGCKKCSEISEDMVVRRDNYISKL